jgi:hypothetical protein
VRHQLVEAGVDAADKAVAGVLVVHGLRAEHRRHGQQRLRPPRREREGHDHLLLRRRVVSVDQKPIGVADRVKFVDLLIRAPKGRVLDAAWARHREREAPADAKVDVTA